MEPAFVLPQSKAVYVISLTVIITVICLNMNNNGHNDRIKKKNFLELNDFYQYVGSNT